LWGWKRLWFNGNLYALALRLEKIAVELLAGK